MLSRALSLATVILVMGWLAAGAAQAQVTNLEAGKSPSQIFAGTCNACHKSPRGLLKTVPASSLPGFLRQHYTTSSNMASVLSSYLVSNGATDTRYQAKDQPKQGNDAKQEPKPGQEARPAGPPDQLDRFGRRQRPAAAPAQEAAKPDADGISPQAEPGRPGRNGKRLARPGETPDTAKPADGQTPVQAAIDSKMGAKQKGKRGKPGAEEPPKPDEAAKDDAGKTATAKSDAKGESDKPDAAKSDGEGKSEGKSETAKVDAPREAVKETGKESGKDSGDAPALRSDPVPPVTPAPPSSTTAATAPEPAASPSPEVSTAAPSSSPAVTASVPSPPPVVPAGPPVPPISQ